MKKILCIFNHISRDAFSYGNRENPLDNAKVFEINNDEDMIKAKTEVLRLSSNQECYYKLLDDVSYPSEPRSTASQAKDSELVDRAQAEYLGKMKEWEVLEQKVLHYEELAKALASKDIEDPSLSNDEVEEMFDIYVNSFKQNDHPFPDFYFYDVEQI